jgi:hypothetical protein
MDIRRWAVIVLASAVLAAACTGPAPVVSPAPTGPEKVQVTDRTKDEIQAVVQAQRDAILKRDLKAYQATFDGERLALRRCKTESFDVAGRTGTALDARVVKVEPYGDTYVRAWVDEGGDRGVARAYFRRVEGRWVQTEPTKDEVGAEKKTTIEGIDIEYWAIDEDVVAALGKGTVAARDSVVENQLTEAKRMFGIRFYPTRTVAGIVECLVVGFHIPNQKEDKFIRFFRYWFTSDLASLSPSTISFIQHEGLHWAQDQFIPGISARLDWWLTEGWPDYIGKSRTEAYKKATICTAPAPTLKQLADGPRTDLPEFPQEEAVRYYAFANTMIEFLYTRFGPSAYRDLLVAYKDLASAAQNFPKVLKVTPDEFYTGWLAFAKQKYC